jgi:hypothetical protein
LIIRAVYIFLIIFTSFLASCQSTDVEETFIAPIIDTSEIESLQISFVDTVEYVYSWKEKYNYDQAIVNVIEPPDGCIRLNAEFNSFTSWLRHLPINLTDNNVYLFNKEKKYNQTAQYKVIDIDVGNKDLQQCADAVMRLRAEYLYASKQYDKIHFNYTNGVNIPFSKWSKGYYPSLKGNKVLWIPSSNNNSYISFKKYMNNIFMYAGTASLEKEMESKKLDSIAPGDVFIRGGFPGHAVIVLDVVINPKTNDKCFLLAQSYMPAQNIHVLNNPNKSSLSPWYRVIDCINLIKSPEWTFYPNELRSFK